MELEPVLLPVREDFGEQRVFFGYREFLTERAKSADRFEFTEPRMQRALGYIRLEPAPDQPARVGQRATQIVLRHGVQNHRRFVLAAGDWCGRAVPLTPWAV